MTAYCQTAKDTAVIAKKPNKQQLHEVISHIQATDQSRLEDLRKKLPPLSSHYIVEIEEVQSLLSKVKLNKSIG